MRTAEFVSPKHADKMCDIISDTILDTLIAQDSNTKCLIETMGYDDSVFISGNVISNGIITNEEIKEIVNNISGINNTTINLTFQENTNQKRKSIQAEGRFYLQHTYTQYFNDFYF
jgi:S-adenosylmethionine synthetase